MGGGGRVIGEGEQLEACYTFHKDTGGSAVSLSNKNEYTTTQSIGLESH